MKPVHIARDVTTDSGAAQIELLESFNDAREARMHLADLAPGTYHVVRFVEANIPVEPPPEVHRNRVGQGTTFITRAAEGKGEPPPPKPRRPKGEGSA